MSTYDLKITNNFNFKDNFNNFSKCNHRQFQILLLNINSLNLNSQELSEILKYRTFDLVVIKETKHDYCIPDSFFVTGAISIFAEIEPVMKEYRLFL